MVNYQRIAIHNVSDIVAVADHAGSYFFTPKTMQSFKSKVLSGIVAVDGYESVPGARFLFITSERYGSDPRHYRVRIMTLGVNERGRPSVDIASVDIDDGIERWATPAAARKAMATFAAELSGASA